MGDYFYDYDAGRYAQTNVGTTSGVTTTIAAVTKQKMMVTGIQVSGDAACVVTIESPANTVLWRKRFTAAFAISETFQLGTIVGANSAAVLVKISASTSNCEANIQAIATTSS